MSATLRALDGEEAERAAARRDAEAPGPGWPCYGGSGVAGARLVAGWSWLTPVVRMPEGTGIRLAAGRPVVLQLGYNLVAAGLGASVRASAEIAVSASAREAELVPLQAERLRLPPGQRQAEASANLVVSRRLAVAGVLPRMHTLGRVLDLVRPRGEERTCVAHFGHGIRSTSNSSSASARSSWSRGTGSSSRAPTTAPAGLSGSRRATRSSGRSARSSSTSCRGPDVEI